MAIPKANVYIRKDDLMKHLGLPEDVEIIDVTNERGTGIILRLASPTHINGITTSSTEKWDNIRIHSVARVRDTMMNKEEESIFCKCRTSLYFYRNPDKEYAEFCGTCNKMTRTENLDG